MGNPICYKGTVVDFNTVTSSGYRDIRGAVQNGPGSLFYGVLLTVRGGNEILQLVSTSDNILFSRASTSGGSEWSDWVKLN